MRRVCTCVNYIQALQEPQAHLRVVIKRELVKRAMHADRHWENVSHAIHTVYDTNAPVRVVTLCFRQHDAKLRNSGEGRRNTLNPRTHSSPLSTGMMCAFSNSRGGPTANHLRVAQHWTRTSAASLASSVSTSASSTRAVASSSKTNPRMARTMLFMIVVDDSRSEALPDEHGTHGSTEQGPSAHASRPTPHEKYTHAGLPAAGLDTGAATARAH
jgi:hypothetical protein